MTFFIVATKFSLFQVCFWNIQSTRKLVAHLKCLYWQLHNPENELSATFSYHMGTILTSYLENLTKTNALLPSLQKAPHRISTDYIWFHPQANNQLPQQSSFVPFSVLSTYQP